MHDGIGDHALPSSPRPGHGDVDPHRRQPDDDAQRGRAPRVSLTPDQPAEDRGHGERQIRAVGQGQSTERPAARRLTKRATAGDVRRAHGKHGAPQRQRQAAVPRHRRQPDRRQHVEHGERADQRGGDATPWTGEREQSENDRHVLDQPERPLGDQRVAEQLVPAHQNVQGSRAVEVQEIDVGHVALAHPLREVQHEALFHRPAGEAIQAT